MNSSLKSFTSLMIGAFAATEIHLVGNIAISELILSFAAPFVFLFGYRELRADGFMPMLWLFALTIIGCIIASIVNHTEFQFVIRGLAAIYVTLAALICSHGLLRDDFSRVRWFFLGYAISNVINIYIFQRGGSIYMVNSDIIDETRIEATLGSVLFWVERLPHWLYVPIRGWYMSTPLLYSAAAPLVVASVCLFASGGSGRSAALSALLTFVLLIIGRKSLRSLQFIRKHFFVCVCVLAGVALGGAKAYQYFAWTGALGESGFKKIEEQTKSGSGPLAILFSARVDFFAGLYCAVRNPIVGYGPWAVDEDGVAEGFMRKYVTEENYQRYMEMVRASLITGFKRMVIPSHSCIVGFWTWYGIFGLLLWLYIIRLYWKTFTLYAISYPPWYGCLASILPIVLWDALFSPFGHRVFMGYFFAMCLMLKAVHENRLPPGGTSHRYIVGEY